MIHDSAPEERLWVLQLMKEFQDITRYYNVELPLPFIRISDNSRQYGSWDESTRTLSLSRKLIESQSWDVVLEIFKHEMAHIWVTERRGMNAEEPHGPYFQEACRRLAVASWARGATVEIDPETARSQHKRLNDEQERQMRRVEKLLSLAQSSNAHEAALAMDRARALSLEYQFERSQKQRVHSYVLINHFKKTMPAHQNAIASLLCTHFYVDCVARSQYDAASAQQHKVLEILGTLENIRTAEYVYWFLWNQLPLLWKTYCGDSRGKRSSQRSFYLGVLNGFHEKLSKRKQGEEQAEANIWALATQDTKALERIVQNELKAFVRERYPRLHRGGGGSRSVEGEAYTSGQRRGRELEIRQGLERDGRVRALAAGKG